MNRKLLIGLAVAVAVLVAGLYAASPFWAMNRLRAAIEAGDRDRLEELVDFPSVRENLKADLNAAMMARIRNAPDLRDNPFAGLGMVLVPAIVDRLVDAMITPAGLAQLSEGESPTPGGQRSESAKAPESKPAERKEEPKLAYGYRDLNRFQVVQTVDRGELTWVFRRRGLFSWQLVRLELPKALLDEPVRAPAS
ncbi:MAG: DUF2939 domain-containing protein [Caulobacter sp.]|nr:DUF2939 domain-containing protein [Caulobacter sp.]